MLCVGCNLISPVVLYLIGRTGQSAAGLTEEPKVHNVLGTIPSLTHTFMETDHETFPESIYGHFPLTLIQEVHLSVTDKSMMVQ